MKHTLTIVLIIISTTLFGQPVLKSWVSQPKNGTWLPIPPSTDSIEFKYSNNRGWHTDDIFNDLPGSGNLMFFYPNNIIINYDSASLYSYTTTLNKVGTMFKTYNTAGQVATSKMYYQPSYIKTYQYNSSGQLISTYTGTNMKDTFTYNGTNLVLSEGYYLVSSAWVRYSKTNYTYNSSNDLTSKTDSTWNTAPPHNLTKIRSTTNTYNSGRQITSVTILYNNLVTSGMNEHTKTLYHYNSTGLLDTITYQKWNATSSFFEDDIRKAYVYNTANKRTNSIRQKWDGTTWTNEKMATFSRVNNFYSEASLQDWNGSAWITANYDTLVRLYYTFPAGINETRKTNPLSCTIYPVPAKAELNISFIQPHGENTTAIVYDMMGKIVIDKISFDKTKPVSTIPINLPNGMYILRLQQDQEYTLKRFMVNK